MLGYQCFDNTKSDEYKAAYNKTNHNQFVLFKGFETKKRNLCVQ